MSASITPRLALVDHFTRKLSREQLERAGDYSFVTLDGQLCVVLRCAMCGKDALADRHKIVSAEPLTLDVPVVCPTGCSYKIVSGKVIA